MFKSGLKKGKALKRLGVDGNAATIRAMVKIQPEAQKHLDYEVLRANGNKTSELNEHLEKKKKVVVQRLKLKRKCNWTNTVKRFPKKLLEDFDEAEEVEAQPEKKAREEAGSRKGVGGLGRKRAPCPCLPQHDFVQPLFKKVKHEASQREPVLRASMLSARLRERFGHLCTDS